MTRTDATTTFDIRLSSMGPQGNNAAGSAQGGNKNLTDQSREFGAPFPRRTVNAIFAKALDTATSNSSLNTTIPEGW